MSTVMMDRLPTGSTSVFGAAQAAPTPANSCIIPACSLKFEKCQGGMKIECCCDDDVACGALQNLCKMLQGGLCNCCCLWKR